VKRIGRVLPWLLVLAPFLASAQIDPVPRDLIQFGYNQYFQGHVPFAGYAYYYHNRPDFYKTNLTWRLALAPVYVDSELGFVHGLGPNTDYAIGLAGGGFGDSYNEIRQGKYRPGESFIGHGGEVSQSVYHLFNPGDLIPLNLVLRGTFHYAAYERSGDTDPAFQLPDNRGEFIFRGGFRWGGVEPTLFPDLAMELSVWYEGEYRTDGGPYGIANADEVQSHSHLFWSEAALSYTLPKTRQNIYMRLTAGSSIDADRFSAYRLGGFLPLIAEYPLSLPGYYYQEISARQFVLLNANYLFPLDKDKRWDVNLNWSTAFVDYLPGEEQPGNWLSGAGGGIQYRTQDSRFKVMLTYAYGVDAIRSGGRGAHSVGLLMQLDLGKLRGKDFDTTQPQHWRGWQWLLPSP